MKILAIDTSCDESCAAIIDTERWQLLADVVHSHVDQMTKYGGVVPEIASREHLRGLPLAVSEALQTAGISTRELDWVAATNRPGLVGALLVGVTFGKTLAYAHQKPFSALDHIEAHLFSPLLSTFETGSVGLPFPWLALVVSGGHTELFHVKGPLDYEWLGGTLDDAAGEAFDKIGKLLGMAYPAGPKIDKLVRESASDSDRQRFAFPRAKTEGLHFSYSGLKTAVATQSRRLKEELEGARLALLASAQEAILDPLVEKVRLAQRKLGVETIVVTGGVACNSRLRQKLPEAYFPPPHHCTDNAAMVALLAGLRHREGKLVVSPWDTTVEPN